MFESSEETPGVEGLHLLDGTIRRIPAAPGLKIPHIGWNDLTFPNKGRLFRSIEEHSYVYFVHSFYLEAADSSIVTATTEYGVRIHASVEKITFLPVSSIRRKALGSVLKFCRIL